MVCKHAYAQKLSALQFIEICERLAFSVAALGFQDQSQGTQHAIVIEWLNRFTSSSNLVAASSMAWKKFRIPASPRLAPR